MLSHLQKIFTGFLPRFSEKQFIPFSGMGFCSLPGEK